MGISDGIFKRITKWNHEQKKKNTLIQLKKKNLIKNANQMQLEMTDN